MTINPEEFRYTRENAGFSTAHTAELLEISERTIRRYESGETPVKARDLLALKSFTPSPSKQIDVPLDFQFIDLFAGIGGLRRGFENIGGRCVFTSEWDKYAVQTYHANYPDNRSSEGDIREFSANPQLIPEHSVLLAGFPCQPFSIAGVSKKNSLGRPHGFLCDTQGTLFYDTAEIIRHHRPAAFLLENVKNLQRHDGGNTFRTILNVLENELGYQVDYKVIDSTSWVPQKRERIFIVGFKDSTKFSFDNMTIPSREDGPKLGSILDSNVDPKYTLSQKLWDYLQNYKKKHEAKGNGFGFGLFGPDDVTRTLSARYYKDGSEVLIRQKGKCPRRLTPRECARLMGFEKPGETLFKIPISDTQAYKQFGNSVVVPVVEAVAKHMEQHLLKAIRSSSQKVQAA